MNAATIAHGPTKPGTYSPAPIELENLTPHAFVQTQPDQFIVALAHEIRNPLTNINLAADMLKSTLTTEDQKIFADIVIRSSVRINNLVTALLMHYQPGETQIEKYSIHQLLDDVLSITDDRIKLKNIAVKKFYTIRDIEIFVNKADLKIALTNILVNSIDAMSSKNGQLILVTKSMNGNCVVEIRDNGAGISKENIKNIFKPYFTNKSGGLGLGLSTTLNILQSNNVGINVQSSEGKGTNFLLSFNKIT